MNKERVVESDKVVSEDEQKIQKALSSICSLLSSSNANQLELECNQFDKLIVPFLEKPHLLDRIIKDSVSYLIDYIKNSIVTQDNQIKPTVNAIFTVLYSIIRARGRKAVVSYFPNDVFLLSPFVHYLKCYDETDLSMWKSQYVLIFWICLLLLSPFDLSSIQEDNDDLAADLYNLSVLYMNRTDSVGEVAAEMLSLFLSRKDIASTYLQPTLDLLCSQLEADNHSIQCVLLCLTSFLKHVHLDDLKSVIETLENVFIKQGDILLESSSIHFKTRILLMKGIRLLCIHHLKLVYEEHKIILSPYSFSSSKPQDQVELPDSLLDFLSTSVSILLSQLQENSILLREKVSDDISKIAVYLPSDFCESLLSELFTLLTSNNSIESLHGCCYTLAALLAQRVIPVSQLPSLISMIQPFITFNLEKRTCSTTAIIRDSACYVFWSLLRCYPSSIYAEPILSCLSSFITLALSDTEINTRRAAAAVLQEIIGRVEVELIPNGIDLINCITYQSVAQLQNIYTVVIPSLFRIPSFQSNMSEFLWKVVNQYENEIIMEHTSHSVYFSMKETAVYIEQSFLQSLLQLDFLSLPYHSLLASIDMIAACLQGFTSIHQAYSLPTSFLSLLPSLLQRSFSSKQQQSLHQAYLSLLQALPPHTSSFTSLFTHFFTLPISQPSTWVTRQSRFTQIEKTLMTCSRWYSSHQDQQNLLYCSQLLQDCLQHPTEFSLHLISSLSSDLMVSSMDSLLSLFSKQLTPEVCESLVLCLGRLLLNMDVSVQWLDWLLQWVEKSCTCYMRDIRGDVGSWARSACILQLEELVDKLVLGFSNETPSSFTQPIQVQGINKYIQTEYGIARMIDEEMIQFCFGTEGSLLFPYSTIPIQSLYSQADHFPPTQSFNQDNHFPPTQSCNQDNHFPPTQSCNQDNHFPPTQSFNQDNHFPPTQSCNQDHNFPPTQSCNQDHNFPPTQSNLPEEKIECLCKVLLKQSAEQHSIIRNHAYSILSYLLQLQPYQLPFLQHLQSYIKKDGDDLIDQLIFYLHLSDCVEIVMNGLIFVVGGNTPVLTEETTKKFIEYLQTDPIDGFLKLMLKILVNEFTKGNNGFYPALKTFTICVQTIFIQSMLSEEEMNQLLQIIKKASLRYKNKIAVLNLLLELLQSIGSSIESSKEAVQLFLPFLSSSFSHIREEASQILFLLLSVNENANEEDLKILQFIEERSFAENEYKSTVTELEKLVH